MEEFESYYQSEIEKKKCGGDFHIELSGFFISFFVMHHSCMSLKEILSSYISPHYLRCSTKEIYQSLNIMSDRLKKKMFSFHDLLIILVKEDKSWRSCKYRFGFSV